MTTRILAMMLTATLGVAGVVFAQQQQAQEDEPDVQVRAPGVQVEANGDQRERENLRETTLRQSKPLIHRASALIGMEVQNSAGKDLGQIDDLAISDDGKIEYAAVSFGGFAGVGDKLFAVPWDAIQVKQTDPSDDEWVAIMEVSEQTLENARGFDQDNWPDMADERWRAENDRAFRTTQEERATTPRR